LTEPSDLSRRKFLTTCAVGMVASATMSTGVITEPAVAAKVIQEPKLAIDGGPKAVDEAVVPAPRWGDAERERLDATLKQNTMFYWQGPQTAELTKRFREVCPVKYVMTCSSGTAALHIAVAAAGIGPGDEVITTSITDVGTVIGVLY